MPQRCNPCQEKAVDSTFVVDSSRLLSFAVGYNTENELNKINRSHRFQAFAQAYVGMTWLLGLKNWERLRLTGLGGEVGPTWRGSVRFVRWDR